MPLEYQFEVKNKSVRYLNNEICSLVFHAGIKVANIAEKKNNMKAFYYLYFINLLTF